MCHAKYPYTAQSVAIFCGQTFVPLAEFMGLGDRDSLRSYQYEDLAPLAVNYYRLKQIDLSAQVNYSEVISARNDYLRLRAGNTAWATQKKLKR